MNTSNKHNQKFEMNIFKHTVNDLFEILLQTKDLFKELRKCSDEELIAQKEHWIQDKEELVKFLLSEIEIDDLNTLLETFDKNENNIIQKYFPYPTPRKLQLETISQIYEAIENGYKYIVLEAVSGFGKTAIATALTRIYSKEKSYILTPKHQLANQYIAEFESYNIKKVNARSHFKCKENYERTKCILSNCKYHKCEYNQYSDFSRDFEELLSCNYLYQLKEGLKADSIITTYPYFFKETFYQSDYLKPRKLIICDEGHNIDEELTNGIRLQITKKQLESLKLDPKEEYENLLMEGDYYYFLLKIRHKYQRKLKNKEKPNAQIKSIPFVKLENKINQITKFLKLVEDNETNLIFEIENNKFTFKPVTINRITKDVLFKYCDVCIFMSSSIFDDENFAYDIGVKKEEIFTLKVPDILDSSTNNPIKIYDEFNMSYDTIKENMDKTIPIINHILDEHKNEKGIIHTFNNKCMEFLVENLDNPRIYTHKIKINDNLEEFKNSSEPLVFISPSLNEGVDLPGDNCRFQIIYKLPYLPPSDARVNKRKRAYEDGDEWYYYKMLTKLIQTYGRGIRFEGDYCKTYILDGRLLDVIDEDLNRNQIIPKYFINAIDTNE